MKTSSLLALCLLFLLSGCVSYYRHGVAESVDSPFTEWGLRRVDDGQMDVFIKDDLADLRDLRVIPSTISLTDSDGTSIPVSISDSGYSYNGRRPIHPQAKRISQVSFSLDMYDPEKPSKSLKRPDGPVRLSFSVTTQGNTKALRGTFLIQTDSRLIRPSEFH
jgi:hypothetical protein